MLEEVLILKPILMSLSSKALLIFAFVFNFIEAQNCDLIVSGYLKDKITHQPLADATVYIEEAQKGAVSNADGYFEIKNICPNSYHIRVNHIGCETHKEYLVISKSATFDIELHHHTFFMDEVILHGKTKEASFQNTQVISKEEITDNGNKNISDMIENIPGVSTLKNGSGISKPIIQGLTGNRILISNNGITQSGQQWGNDHAPEIDPFTANHISVIKGSSALAYSGNSLGGVVLVEPDEISDEPHLHGKTTYLFQDNGNGHTANVQLEQKNKFIAWRTVATYKKIGDMRTPTYFLTNTGKEEKNIAFQLEKKITPNWKSQLNYSYFSTQIGILRGATADADKAIQADVPYFTNPEFSYAIASPNQRVTHHFLKSKNVFTTTEKSFWQFNYATQINNREEFDVRRGNRNSRPVLSLRHINNFGEALFQTSFSENNILKSGVQLSINDNTNDPVTNVLPLIPDYFSVQPGVFAILQKKTPHFMYEIGGRYDYKNMQVVAIISDVTRSIERFSYQFNTYSFSGGIKHNNDHNFKTSLNMGYVLRAPEINELHSDGVHQGVAGYEEGSRFLQSEKSFKSTLSFDWSYDHSFFIQISPYYQRITDFIYLQPQSVIRQGVFLFTYQQTNAQIVGIDGMTSYEPVDFLKLIASFSFIQGDDKTNNLPLIGMPANNLTGEIQYRGKDLNTWKKNSFSLTHRYVFKQTHLNASQDLIAPPPAYHLLNAAITSTLQLKKTSLKFSVRVENALNTAYRDYLNRLRYYSNEVGRTIIASLSYDF